MGDQVNPGTNTPGNGSMGDTGGAAAAEAEPVRTRWTPKPEQILILESIFNSGMVNPPKDETVRIRKLLEKFGSVGDANVFYWFQNRRSRSRRRQRQMQAGQLAGDARTVPAGIPSTGGATPYDATSPSTFSTSSSNSSPGGLVSSSATAACTAPSCCSPCLMPDDGAEDLFSISRQMGFGDSTIDRASIYSPALPPHSITDSGLYHHSGLITVFVNGILQEVPRGPFDMRAVFGQEVMLVHSSGEVVPMNDYGVLFQGLFAGESYFLVPRSM